MRPAAQPDPKAAPLSVVDAWDLMIAHGKVLLLEAARAENWERVVSLGRAMLGAHALRARAWAEETDKQR